MESVDFLAICTSIYSTSRERKKLLRSCSNPRPGSRLGVNFDITLLIRGCSSSTSSPEIDLRSQKRKNTPAKIIGETPTTKFQHLQVAGLCWRNVAVKTSTGRVTLTFDHG